MRKIVCGAIIGLLFNLGAMLCKVYASQIVFVCFGGEDIRIINADGTDLKKLTEDPESREGWPTWSPDAEKIAFSLDKPGDLYLMDADGGNRVLLTEIYAPRSRPSWSPDGQKIVLAFHVGIFVLDLVTGELERLLPFMPSEGFRDPAWPPDGRQIAFTIRQERQRDIYVVNADGNQLRQLTKHRAEDHAPAWSPDGRQIAFYSNRNGGDGIHLMDADGSNLRRLTNGGEDFPSWSPTGSHIAVQIRGNVPHIGVMRTDGRDLKILAEGYHPSWQPVGLAVNKLGTSFSIWGLVKEQGRVFW